MRLHPMVIYTLGAVGIWLILVDTTMKALGLYSFIGIAYVGGCLALFATFSMRLIEWLRGDERRKLVDERKLERLKSQVRSQEKAILEMKARHKSVEAELKKTAPSIQLSTGSTPKEGDESKEKIASLSTELRETRQLLKVATADRDRLTEEMKSLGADLSINAAEVTKAKTANAFITSQFQQVTAELERITEENNSLRLSKTVIHEELNETLALLATDSNALNEAKESLQVARSSIQSLERELGNREKVINALKTELTNSKQELRESELAYKHAQSEIDESRLNLMIMGDGVKNLCQELAAVKDSLSRQEVEQGVLKADLESVQAWKAHVETFLSAESINSLKYILERLIEILDEDRKLEVPRFTDVVEKVYEALHNVAVMLDRYEAEYKPN